jgi:hypothetical protein
MERGVVFTLHPLAMMSMAFGAFAIENIATRRAPFRAREL